MRRLIISAILLAFVSFLCGPLAAQSACSALTGADGSEQPGEVVEEFLIVDHGREFWTMPVQNVFGTPVGLTRYERISPVSFE